MAALTYNVIACYDDFDGKREESMDVTKGIRILHGAYAGCCGEIIEEGAFDCFGTMREGVKVHVSGLAGPIIVDHGRYERIMITTHTTPARFARV